MSPESARPNRPEMERMLRQAGSVYDLAGVTALIAGVLAAPPAIGASWHALVADPMPPGLGDALEALRQEMAAGYRYGLGREDFARLSRAERLARLRRELERQALAGFIVPRADAHQGEYVPPNGQRLLWLTGFTGSAGLAIVLSDRAALFVDGRYTLQAAQQVDGRSFAIHHLIDEPPAQWLATALAAGTVLGYDPWLHTPNEVERLRTAAARAGAALQAVADNPLDRVWSDRPPAPLAPVVPHNEAFAGESAASKRARLGQALAKDGVDAAALTMPEIDRVAAQHPGRRRAAYAAASLLRDLAPRRRRRAVHRPPQIGARPRTTSRQSRDGAAARTAGSGARCARRRRRPGAGRPGQCGVMDL